MFVVLCWFFVCYDVNSVNKNKSKYYKTVLAVDFLDYIIIRSNNGHRDTRQLLQSIAHFTVTNSFTNMYINVIYSTSTDQNTYYFHHKKHGVTCTITQQNDTHQINLTSFAFLYHLISTTLRYRWLLLKQNIHCTVWSFITNDGTKRNTSKQKMQKEK